MFARTKKSQIQMTNIISGISFPAIRGTQADSEFYTVMCPLKRLCKIFTFEEHALPVQDRAQRTLNPDRIPDITNYILSERNNYVFSSITACIDGDSIFTPISTGGPSEKIGTLTIDEDAEIYITDGQHRNAAILEALKHDPTLGGETISVVFFANKSLTERQKIFKDLNLFPVKTDSSLSITYDDKPHALLSKEVVFSSDILSKIIHMEKSNLGKRSKKLVSHSALNKATIELFDEITVDSYKNQIPIAIEYWETIVNAMPAWLLVYKDKISGGEVREDTISAYSVTFQALGIVGNWLLKNDSNWKKRIYKLKEIDWARSNKENWEGRCVINGAMRNSSIAIKLTANKIKEFLKIELNDQEQVEEQKFNKLTTKTR